MYSAGEVSWLPDCCFLLSWLQPLHRVGGKAYFVLLPIQSSPATGDSPGGPEPRPYPGGANLIPDARSPGPALVREAERFAMAGVKVTVPFEIEPDMAEMLGVSELFWL